MKKIRLMLGLFALVFIASACEFVSTNRDAEFNGEGYFLAIDINPSVEFIIDEEGIVVSVNLLNEDAEIVAAELDLIGLPYEEALALYLEAAVEAGYLDVDEVNIITITSDDEEFEEEVKEEVNEELSRRGIGAAIFGGEMKEEYVELAELYDIGVGRARLISRAIDIEGTLTFEEALELEHSEIMKILVEEHHAQREAFINERKALAQEMREMMKEMVRERVEQHRGRVEQGEITRGNNDQLRDEIREDLEQVRHHYRERVEAMREAVRERKNTENNED